MNKKEFEIYEKAIKEKYKFHNLWKFLAILFAITTAILCVLYFGSGEIFTENINNNSVEIINEGDGDNTNNVIINN